MIARGWWVGCLWVGLLSCACKMPAPQYALTVRDPDKLCRLIAFSRCARVQRDEDAGSNADGGAEE